MGVDRATYHGWQGPLRMPGVAALAIVRVALLQVFRRKAYWFVLGLGLLNFLYSFALIYTVTQLPAFIGGDQALDRMGFSPRVDPQGHSGYIDFIERQGIIVMILLAFAGSLLVGSDFRMGSLPFYLSRRIDRRHYIAGKLLSVATLVWLVTVIPALCLFVEYGMFTSSFDYWLDNYDVALGIIGHGSVMALVLSILLVTISAYLERMAPIAIVWSSLFIMLGLVAALLRELSHNRTWLLLNPWVVIRYTGRLFYEGFREGKSAYLGWWGLLILSVVCSAMLVALVYRVRAVEVVE